MTELERFAATLRRLAEGSQIREASSPLKAGLRITLQHEDTTTGERVFTLNASRYHTPPLPDDLAPIAEAFGVASGSEWNWHSKTKNGGQYHTAWCRWHERCTAQLSEQAA